MKWFPWRYSIRLVRCVGTCTIIQYLGSDRQQVRGLWWCQRSSGWQVWSTSGDSCLLLSRAPCPPATCCWTQHNGLRPFCKGPCLEFSNTERANESGFTLGLKWFCSYSLIQGPPNNVNIMRSHRLFLWSSDEAWQPQSMTPTKVKRNFVIVRCFSQSKHGRCSRTQSCAVRAGYH